jgi:PAS domain S-box-containing protein
VNADDLRKEEILVVDDEPANLKLLQQLLTEANYKVKLASSGELALRGAKLNPPALILLDIMMPGMDGYETCRRLKDDEETSGIPVIFLSALESEQDKVKAFEAGGVDYVTKPIRAAELLARMGTHLALRRALLDLEQRNNELEAIRIAVEDKAEKDSEDFQSKKATLQQKIEAQLQSLADLRTSEQYNHGLLNNANEGIWKLGPDLTTYYVNAKMGDMLGYKVSQMLGRPVSDFMFEEDVPHYLRRMDGLRAGIALRHEGRFRHKDGREVIVLVSVSPIFDNAQHFLGVFGVLVDLAGLKSGADHPSPESKEQEAVSVLMARDLRAVASFCAALEKSSPGGLNTEAQFYLDLIRRNVDEMEHLVSGAAALPRRPGMEETRPRAAS